MPEKTKQKKDDCEQAKNELKKNAAGEPDSGERGNWSEDQKEKSYYYDDGYGYEVYDPDAEDDDENC